MIKTLLFTVALMSLALATGCAKGGNGVVPPQPAVTVKITSPSNSNPNAIYATQTLTLTAMVTNASTTSVTWTLSGASCTGSACGTISPITPATNPATATYVAPQSPTSVKVTATLTGASVTGSLDISVIPVTVVVTPATVNVGQNLVQQFTAISVPDAAPQSFTWTCTPTGACGSFAPNANNVAVYTAPPSPFTGNIVVTATSTVQQSTPGVGQAKVSVVASRVPPGAYAFRFSGDDTSSHHVAIAGSLTVSGNGTITGGVEDVVTNGSYNRYATISGSYVPSPNNNNDISNNLGTLTVSASGGPTYSYTAVVTSSGIIRMIESDGAGTGSGVMQKSAANTVFNAGQQTFVFGFTGVDSTGGRIGYVGLLPMTPSGTGGTISGGVLDINDKGSNPCGATPCNVTGTYQLIGTGLWHMTLNSVTTLDFDFFVSGGQTNTQPNPLTLYAISTDDPTSHPSLSGNMVYQFPLSSGYNNAAFKGSSVSSLTGANANVALIIGTTDGASEGTGGTGGFTGTFDQNDNGVITSVTPTKPFSYTYVATPNINGRYTIQMLGNTNPVVAPLPFVLYASGANRGFLLDQSSIAVITGSMDPQLPAGFNYTPLELPGTYAAATIGNSDSAIEPVVQNLLLTSPGGTPPVYDVAGIQTTHSASQTLTGSYTMTNNSTGGGTGTITLTSPPPPAVTNYVIYAIDGNSTNSVITDFMMMGLTSGTPSSIIFAQQ